jgi:hypothetical protein
MGSLSIWRWLIVLLIVALVVLGPEPLLRTTRRQGALGPRAVLYQRREGRSHA